MSSTRSPPPCRSAARWPPSVPSPEPQLTAEVAATAGHLATLRREFTQLVQASEASNADDEHDPEGATIGFERAQLSALINQAESRLADLERALQQVRDGGDGVCERCGGAPRPPRGPARAPPGP